ncbi:MAG: MazG family protein, partial [Magnetococcales bacterium]|nr:MazG family protein [Magnetococcales bacterium]
QEEGLFTLAEVIQGVTGKMRRRHPHLFDPDHPAVAEQLAHAGTKALRDNWEKIKREEKSDASNGVASVFDGLPGKLPALHLAYKVQQKMARVGFDWPDPDPVRAKVDEELAELEGARAKGHHADIEEEMGDVLFTLANYARHLGVNPEKALRRSVLKFQDRFRYIERQIQADGLRLQEVPLPRLESLWQESKQR